MATNTNSTPRAGTLRRKLTFQQRPAATDSYGFHSGSDTAWTDVLVTWGSVAAKQGTALMQVLAGQIMPTSAYTITVRYPPSIAITAGMRVLDGTEMYTVQSVNDPDQRRRTLVIYATQAPAPAV